MTETCTYGNTKRNSGTYKNSFSNTCPDGKKALNYAYMKAQNTNETNDTHDAGTSSYSK